VSVNTAADAVGKNPVALTLKWNHIHRPIPPLFTMTIFKHFFKPADMTTALRCQPPRPSRYGPAVLSEPTFQNQSGVRATPTDTNANSISTTQKPPCRHSRGHPQSPRDVRSTQTEHSTTFLKSRRVLLVQNRWGWRGDHQQLLKKTKVSLLGDSDLPLPGVCLLVPHLKLNWWLWLRNRWVAL